MTNKIKNILSEIEGVLSELSIADKIQTINEIKLNNPLKFYSLLR